MKKVLAAAVAAAIFTPVVATANNVTIYGKAHVMMIDSDQDDIADNWELSSTNSRLGFKGSEDLGNGLKAIWKYETTVNITDGGRDGGTFGSARNAYVGLAGDWGTVLFGRHDHPVKVAWYAAGNDHLDGAIIDFNDCGFGVGMSAVGVKCFRSDIRSDNVLAYISPSFNGLTVAAAVLPGEDDGVSSGSENDSFADSYSLGIMYNANGIKASGGYESIAGPGGSDFDDEERWFLAGSYTINGFTFGGSYEYTDNVSDLDDDLEDFFDPANVPAAGNEDDTQSTWGLSAKYVFGNNAVLANYIFSEIDPDGGNNSIDVDSIGFALQHFFSKRTSVYAAYNRATFEPDNDNDVDNDQYGVGMIHNF